MFGGTKIPQNYFRYGSPPPPPPPGGYRYNIFQIKKKIVLCVGCTKGVCYITYIGTTKLSGKILAPINYTIFCENIKYIILIGMEC